MTDHIAFLGFGEAATAFLTGWGALRPAQVSAFDTLVESGDTRDALQARYARHRVKGAMSPQDAVGGADVIFSLVTADQALPAARAAAAFITPNALWLDGNSCAPDTKRAAAAVVTAAGGRYVDVAVMAPVHPKGHHAPLSVSGPDAAAAVARLRALDMRPTIVGDTVGQASMIKMLRSVMIKGIEALSAECFLAAHRAGVADAVIASLDVADPGADWHRRGAYHLERMMVHGTRRAAEMREAAATVAALGLSNIMTQATVDWQDRIGATDTPPGPDGDLAGRSDALLRRL